MFENSRQLEIVKISETQVAAIIEGWETIKEIKSIGTQTYEENWHWNSHLEDIGRHSTKHSLLEDNTGNDNEAEKSSKTFTTKINEVTETYHGGFPSVLSAIQNYANKGFPYNSLPSSNDFKIDRLYLLLDTSPSSYWSTGPTLSIMAEGSSAAHVPNTTQTVESKAERYLPKINELLPMLITVNNGTYARDKYRWKNEAYLEAGFDKDIFKAIEWKNWIKKQLLSVSSVTSNGAKQDKLRNALNNHQVDESNWNRVKNKVIWNIDLSDEKAPLSRYWKSPYIIDNKSIIDYLTETVTLKIPNQADENANNASYQDFTRLELIANLLKKSDITFSYKTGGSTKTAKLDPTNFTTKIYFEFPWSGKGLVGLTLNEATFTPKVIPDWSIGKDRAPFSYIPRPLFIDKQNNPFTYNQAGSYYELKNDVRLSDSLSITTDAATLLNNALH